MRYESLANLPVRLTVGEIVSSRYPDNKRPESWEARRAGLDVVRTEDGRTLRLASDGGQSPPQPGWVIMVTEGDLDAGYRWTLYGLPAAA